ncbi:MAG: decaprenyl-phosphate phosphoribosyltransferase [Ignavibacteriales bacterium]|nr:decaprenyl-phosphate phosphoribosyltransferase [Ignavibacteriales bacterium]
MKVREYFRLLRPVQWTKNLFLFTPLIFSRHLFDWTYVLQALWGFVAFSLISSCVYIINDIFDRETDRSHPEKKFRPIAAGTVSIPGAIVLAAILFAASIILSWKISMPLTVIVCLYFVIQFFYSIRLKHIVILDIFVVAAGFMMRVIAGAEVINVMISNWIVLCTMFLSLFLAVAKRRGESVLAEQDGRDIRRKVLAEYDIRLFDQMMMITSTGMAISYALYTVAERTIKVFGTEYLIFTTIFVLFGIFRYLLLIYRNNAGENPVMVLLRDKPTFINVILWLISCVLIIY